MLRRRTLETAPDSPLPLGPHHKEGRQLICGISVGQVSQRVCPARHRDHIFESNLSQQADVGQQLIYEAVEGAPHGFASRVEARKQGETFLARRGNGKV